MIDIGIQSEYILSFFGINVTNTFFTTICVTLILVLMALWFNSKKNSHDSIIINGLRILVYELLKLTDMVTGDRELSKKILPLIATFFIFIVSANLIALIPGFLGSFFVNISGKEVPLLRSPNSDLTVTLALAIVSVFSIQYFSVQVLGFWKFLKRFFDFSGPIKFILGFFELLSESIKVLSFSFRLFGNVFAGEVLLLIIGFLIPYIIPLPFMILEVFVGIIQAFIFTILTLTFIKTGTVKSLAKN